MKTRSLLLSAALAAGWACSDNGTSAPPAAEQPESTPCVGKCDSADSTVDTSRYVVDLAAANAIWSRGGPEATSLADFYTAIVKLPNGMTTKAPTHLFGGPVVPIPYHDDDGAHVVDANGDVVQQGDRELAKFFPPGAIGYAIKHHRPEHRVIDFNALAGAGGSADAIKEDLKLQDTHIELVVGVRRPLGAGGELVDGVITLNNPQNYQSGRFGSASYSMVFVEPAWPDYLPAAQQVAFRDNIRTMMLAFNAVSDFPGDYNGGDPLAASSPDKVREHVAQMVKAITGDADAQAWFRDPRNMIYCAELAHVASSAGVLVPLNKAGLVDSGLVDAATYDAFAALIDAHQAGQSTAFTTMNDNALARFVEATMAPADLAPLPSYSTDAAEAEKLAFRPLTVVEIVEGFLKTHLPRNEPALGGEALAPVQAAVLTAMKPALFETMGLDDGLHVSIVAGLEDRIASVQEELADPALTDEQKTEQQAALADLETQLAQAKAMQDAVAARRAGADAFFDEVIAVIGKQYGSYDEFRANIAPYLAQARALATPRDDSGNGFFVPPSALHLIAQKSCDGDLRCGGLLGLDYVGHGVHLSAIDIVEAIPEPTPTAIPRIGSAMARPGSDYNEDGVVDARDDEFVRFVNDGDAKADLSGWTLADAVKVRFTFPADAVIEPGGSLWVHAAHATPEPGVRYAAGVLGLNDSGDTLTLSDASGAPVDTLSWGAVDVDEEIVPPVEE